MRMIQSFTFRFGPWAALLVLPILFDETIGEAVAPQTLLNVHGRDNGRCRTVTRKFPITELNECQQRGGHLAGGGRFGTPAGCYTIVESEKPENYSYFYEKCLKVPGANIGYMHPDQLASIWREHKGQQHPGTSFWLSPRSDLDTGRFLDFDGMPITFSDWTKYAPDVSDFRTLPVKKQYCVGAAMASTPSWYSRLCEEQFPSASTAVCQLRREEKEELCDDKLIEFDKQQTCTFNYESEDPAQRCPPMFTLYEPAAKCYYAYKFKDSYSSLVRTCKEMGGHLASAHTHQQMEFLRELLREVIPAEEKANMYSTQDPQMYLGINRHGVNDQGQWAFEKWDDGSPYDFALWGSVTVDSNLPDNLQLQCIMDERYARRINDRDGFAHEWRLKPCELEGYRGAHAVCSVNARGSWNRPECEHHVGKEE